MTIYETLNNNNKYTKEQGIKDKQSYIDWQQGVLNNPEATISKNAQWWDKEVIPARSKLGLCTAELTQLANDEWIHRERNIDSLMPWAGQICYVNEPECQLGERISPQLCVVRYVSREEHDQYASIAYLSADLDMAGGTDVILDSKQTGLPYKVMVMSYLINPVFYCQLSEPIGCIGQEEIDGLLETEYTGAPDIPNAPTGLPLCGPEDPRWQWQLNQFETVKAIGGLCISKMLYRDFYGEDKDKGNECLSIEDAQDEAEAICKIAKDEFGYPGFKCTYVDYDAVNNMLQAYVDEGLADDFTEAARMLARHTK